MKRLQRTWTIVKLSKLELSSRWGSSLAELFQFSMRCQHLPPQKPPKRTSFHLIARDAREDQLLFHSEQWCPDRKDYSLVFRDATPIFLCLFEPSLPPAWCPSRRWPQILTSNTVASQTLSNSWSRLHYPHGKVLGHILGQFSSCRKHFKEIISELHLFSPFWNKEQET